MSKFSLDVLQRCVFPYTKTEDPDVILGAVFGEDVAFTRVGGDILVSHLDPIVGAIGNIGWLAVHVACNDIATAGIPPRWILMLILVPQLEDEEFLEKIMRDVRRAASEIKVSIIGGHTGYSADLSRPLVSVTALGTASGRNLVRTKGAQVGDHVVVTKGIGLEGTVILAATVPSERVRNMSQALTELGTKFAIVGRVTEGMGVRVLQDGTSVHYREIHCEEDELARMWSLYPRDKSS
jgi:hydrogenase expression/formation protein HypE